MDVTVHTDEPGFRTRRDQPTRVEAFVDAAGMPRVLIWPYALRFRRRANLLAQASDT
jgi:hypothetical protein